MDKRASKLTSAAWISRFWAYYHLLPEELGESFTSMARSLARDWEKKRRSGNGDLGRGNRDQESTEKRHRAFFSVSLGRGQETRG
ncbi:MAG: hypothetical protein MdMp014T_0132 [Treponematales bacterium]